MTRPAGSRTGRSAGGRARGDRPAGTRSRAGSTKTGSSKTGPSKTGPSKTGSSRPGKSADKASTTGSRRPAAKPAPSATSRRGRVGAGSSPLNPGFSRRWLVAIGGVVVAGLLAWVLFFSSVFAADQVQVSGSSAVSKAEVESALAIAPGTPLLTIDTDELEQRVETIPAVRDATVTRSWPSTVEVTIRDRSPVATVEIDGAPWLIDETGTPYAEAAGADPKQTEGLRPLELDDPAADDLATKQTIEVLLGLPDGILEQVASLSAPSPAQVTLHLADGRTVIWGDASKMADKATMLPGLLEHSGSVFDISSPQAIVIS